MQAQVPCRIFGDLHGQFRDLLLLFAAWQPETAKPRALARQPLASPALPKRPWMRRRCALTAPLKGGMHVDGKGPMSSTETSWTGPVV